MLKIPAISVDGDVLRGRLVAAVDLSRVDPGIRGDVVRELALGSSPAPLWRRKESRLHEVKPTGVFGWMSEAWGLDAVFPVLLTFLVWLGVCLASGIVSHFPV